VKNLPVLLDVSDKTCLIVGGGRIATRRAKGIASAGIRINVVAEQLDNRLQKLCEDSGGLVSIASWQKSDIHADYVFVIAATDNHKVNRDIAAACHELGVAVNVSSDHSLSDIAFPTVIDRDPINISVSSGSASPILAKLLAGRIDSIVPAGYGRLAELVTSYRAKVNEVIQDPAQRKLFWERVLTGNVAESIFSGNADAAEKLLLKTLNQETGELARGEVYLIGAGPGDPDLLTFRAYRLLQQSEVVLYDRLVSDRILEQINPEAEMIYVGKKRASHSMLQGDINQTLVTHAKQGKRVARLKGGDPFIFGRGGEEIELLAENRIPFQVVPGITAASGCACYSGIPLTHRDHAQSVRFVTGQLKDGTVDLPWDQLVAPDQTVVIYMGLVGLPIISSKLMENGLDPDTPAAMIEQGTTLDQKIHCSTIEKLPAIIAALPVQAPTLMIIGSVVTLHESLKWFQPPES
jgi:uroporphyrin-III C-methyltransferase/precorrin-2 dehydrogenase/sirohydrochlorin ferrochelatase